MDDLLRLSALEMRDRLAAADLRAADLAEVCIARIEAREPEIGAWAWFDPDHARKLAADLDAHRAAGRAIGPLHGLPVGLKDIIDTVDIPTENGTVLDADRVPSRDAWVAARLKQAGALILGKTVTTELAFLHPAKTRNPVNRDHTPGGSSAGSAAAVADHMVPLAVGTQTAGSVIRPAAFCGVVGFKPSFGAIPRTGILRQAPSLDTVGVFATDLGAAALIAQVLFGHDPDDPASIAAAAPDLLEAATDDLPADAAVAFVRSPAWASADEDTKLAFSGLVNRLGDVCEEVVLPPDFAEAMVARERIHLAEMAENYGSYVERGRDRLSRKILDAIEHGERVLGADYRVALEWPARLNTLLEAIFQRFDAIVTPAAPGPAPSGLDTTGSPVFNGLWTFCGTPAVTLPLLAAANGMPMGVQLVGPRGADARLLRTARWLSAHLDEPPRRDGEE